MSWVKVQIVSRIVTMSEDITYLFEQSHALRAKVVDHAPTCNRRILIKGVLYFKAWYGGVVYPR